MGGAQLGGADWGLPDQVRAWIDADGGLNGPYRPGLRTPDDAALDLSPVLVGVAFVGRVSTEDQQDPVGSLMRQLRICRAALPANCTIVAHFYDVESGRKDLDVRGRVDPRSAGLAIPIPRDGGIRTCSPRPRARTAGSRRSSASRSTGSPAAPTSAR